MSTPQQEQRDQTELENLRIIRATLESVKQLVDGIGNDVRSAAHNYSNVTELSRRWADVLSETKDALKKAKEKEGGSSAAVPAATENAEVSLV